MQNPQTGQPQAVKQELRPGQAGLHGAWPELAMPQQMDQMPQGLWSPAWHQMGRPQMGLHLPQALPCTMCTDPMSMTA